jgi:DNA-binding response OmpR family regulator
MKTDRPCLVLLDLMLPGLSGEGVRRAQLADPELARLPTVLVTGAPDVRAVARELAPVAVIRKPFDLEEILAIVRSYCPQGTPDGSE